MDSVARGINTSSFASASFAGGSFAGGSFASGSFASISFASASFAECRADAILDKATRNGQNGCSLQTAHL